MKDATGRSVSLLNETTPFSVPTTYASKRKYHCNEPGCNKSFTTSGHLARHHRIHTGEKNFPCLHPGCPSRFSRQDNMMQHYRTHLSPKSRRQQVGRVSKTFLPPRLHTRLNLDEERSMVYSLMDQHHPMAIPAMPLMHSPIPLHQDISSSRIMLPSVSLPPPAPLEPSSPMISPTIPTDPEHHHRSFAIHRRPQRTHSSSSNSSVSSAFLSPRLSMSPPPLDPSEVLFPKPIITALPPVAHYPLSHSRRHPLDLAHIVSTIG
ncbi:hypothetical protein DM01DRAFT_322237 [Hesseltinella vesiculosa]|uniref:C2H2-type domain-containing protein n=1 Tax=Hesseltinella vesiculosa TaxID=101127 RepID=A0A1X2G5H4_9FUNG|nr:hypothetical protein DM01DRAFT_322237 [Hesseltinella vesiculosa]